jgi:hypothetical protein
MTTTVPKPDLTEANERLDIFKAHLETLSKDSNSDFRAFADELTSILSGQEQVTPENGNALRDAVMASVATHRPTIYFALKAKGELEGGIRTLHDIIHDAAMFTNAIYFALRPPRVKKA